MHTRKLSGTIVAAIALLTAACATSQDWALWRSHTTHFASGDHGIFSLVNNKDGSNPKVTRTDIENARVENWWGNYPISVSPNQIFQN